MNGLSRQGDARNPWQRFLDGLGDVFNLLGLALDEGYRQLERLLETCVRYGWCFTPDASLLLLAKGMTRVNQADRTQHELYRMMRDHYASDAWHETEALVDAMTAASAKRRKILYDCVATLKLNRTLISGRRFNAPNVVVPTLVAAIDGMLSDFAAELRIANWHSKNPSNGGPSAFHRLKGEMESVCYAFDRPALDLVFGVLFATAKPHETIPASGRQFNRHRILHGNWLEYGRVESVIRLFLMARFVDYVITEYRAQCERQTSHPVTTESQYSKLLSENVLAPIRDYMTHRAQSRGLFIARTNSPLYLP